MIECDSCWTGGGAFSEERCYAEEYSPDFVQAYPLIHELEALNLVVTLRTLHPDVSAGLGLNMDKATSAHALKTGRATNATLMACALAHFIAHLHRELPSPASVAWVHEVRGQPRPFGAPFPDRVRHGRSASSCPRCGAPRRSPLKREPPPDGGFFRAWGCAGAVPWAALIMVYFSLLHQSNLLSPSRAAWGWSPHPVAGGCY